MRTAGFILMICLVAFPAIAQEETLIKGDIESGGFGGPVVKFTSMNGETGILVGGRGGWIINHSFIIGGGGYGLANNINARVPGPSGERYVNFGYGGVELEYIPRPARLIHWSYMVLIGGGGVNWRDENMRAGSMNQESETFFVLEPEVNVTVNITTYFRLSGGLSYRYITGSSSAAASNADLSGLSGVIVFRFGKF